MSDCKNCKHLVMYDYKNKSYSCESRECEFEPKEQEPTTKARSDSELIARGDVINMIKELPTVTPQEPKTGHWIESDALLVIGNTETDNFLSIPAKECSVCHKPHIRAYAMNYCPNCGAKMAESEAEDG